MGPIKLPKDINLGASELSLETKLEILSRQINRIEDIDDPELAELLELRNQLEKERHIKQLEHELKALMDGDDELSVPIGVTFHPGNMTEGDF